MDFVVKLFRIIAAISFCFLTGVFAWFPPKWKWTDEDAAKCGRDRNDNEE